MCGIFGIVGIDPSNENEKQNFKDALNLLQHRGPDAHATWFSQNLKLAIGHTRLSIQDLSINGKQPMISRNGRYVLTFNGEIYNHRDLRHTLESDCQISYWNGRSDTETLLESMSLRGVDWTLNQIEGMFAFALVDIAEKSLYLARDRIGEKPLYYGNLKTKLGTYFCFSSELKPLIHFPSEGISLSKRAVNEYLRLNYVPSPLCILEDFHKLSPGEYLKINFNDSSGRIPLKYNYKKYWEFQKVVTHGISSREPDGQSNKKLHSLLKSKISAQLLSDVPVGAFLSGGTDSSLITAIMQETSKKKISTYTIGFTDEAHDEAGVAKKIASVLGTEHNEAYLEPRQAIQIASEMPNFYDEPFADSSQVPTYLLSRFASKDVSVVLSGDGGDESFGGYNRYIHGEKIWKRVSRLPGPLRKIIGKSILKLNDNNLYMIQTILENINPRLRGLFLSQKISRFGSKLITSNNFLEFYVSLVTNSRVLENDDLILPRLRSYFEDLKKSKLDMTNAEVMMYLDTLTYLSDDICAKVDRAAMSNSLEVRAPFLNHKIIEYAWEIPISQKIMNGTGKVQLKEILKCYLPSELVDLPKKGFSIPLSDWLREDLSGWATDVIENGMYNLIGMHHKSFLEKLWIEHRERRKDNSSEIWGYLMLLGWLHNYKGYLSEMK